jgi:Domain of unknown function (DUF4160)
MPTVARIGAIQIRFDYEDHGIPHFHAIGPNFDFKFAIADGSVISGNGRISGRELAVIRSWAGKHRAVLLANWQRARDAGPLQDIED